MMEDLVIYRDKELMIGLPSYLNPKKGIRNFVVDRRKVKNFAIESMGIDINFNEERARETMKILSRTIPFSEWNGVTQRIVQLGEVCLKGQGFELLSESFRSDTSVYVYRYDRIFCLVENVHYAYAVFSLSGTSERVGPIEDFYQLSRRIVESAEMITT